MKKYIVLFFITILLTSCNNSLDEVTIKISQNDEPIISSDDLTDEESNITLVQVSYHIENEKIKVNINQVGYLPLDDKVAIFRGESPSQNFSVINTETNETVFKGLLTDEMKNKNAGETNVYGDFSSLQQPGNYYITSDYGDSFPFVIKENVYDPLLLDITRMFYLQRCGSDLEKTHAGEFSHASCHDDLAQIYNTDIKIDVTGGWHDAGDYGRYIVPAAKSIADLIMAYEAAPNKMDLSLNIPESNNQIPDILDEVYYELLWFLKMQDPKTGGVYHKVTGQNFPGTMMPDMDTSIMIVSPISDAATANFSAVMAMSAFSYKELMPAFSKECLEASVKAYNYLYSKDDFLPFNNPKGILTGQYGDDHLSDEMFWASVELFKATEDTKYHDAIKKYYDNNYLSLGWSDMGGYGACRYLSIKESLIDDGLVAQFKKDLIKKADTLVTLSKQDGYFISMGNVYPWGSNMTVSNHAMFLQLSHGISKDKNYLKISNHHINYLLGANPMAMSYVTGYGSISPTETHHRPSQFLRNSMPGMLVGGPNSNLQDPYAAETLRDVPPAKCYLDVAQSYSCNEVTIYWNSPLVFILSQK